MTITQERLRELLTYDPETGGFKWCLTMGKAISGCVAGSRKSNGYLRIGIEGKLYASHRLAWLYQYGELPSGFIDHINGHRSDNRISNLRLATRTENNRNSGMRSDNTSDIKGVSWDAQNKRWRAQIWQAGKVVYMQNFTDKNEARIAVERKRIEFHGEFANHGGKLS